jgi:hypothetical protein
VDNDFFFQHDVKLSDEQNKLFGGEFIIRNQLTTINRPYHFLLNSALSHREDKYFHP